MTNVQSFATIEAFNHAAAAGFVRAATAAIEARGRFAVALSGGNTPQPIHALLAQSPYRQQVDWPRVHVFFGDERCVPADDPRNNAKMAFDTLLSHVPVPPGQVYAMPSTLPPAQAAAQYQATLLGCLGGEAPRLDLIILGLGDDAHTASLFPRTAVLRETERWVAGLFIEKVNMDRITLTARTINQAREVAFWVAGAGKANALRQVLQGTPDPEQYPAQLIHPTDGHLHWLLDAAAASGLKP